MSKKIGFIVFMVSCFSYAQEQTTTSTVIVEAAPKSWTLSANLETSSFLYKEPGVMTVDGRLYGISGQFQYNLSSTFWSMANATYLSGVAQYDGSLQDQNSTPIKSKDQFKILDASAKGLILTDISLINQVSLYLGLGQRITEDLNDPSPNDYYRKHIYNYYSFGTHILIPHTQLTTSVVIVGIDTMFSGTTQTKLSDVSKSYPDFTVKFKGGSALNIEWQLNRTFNDVQFFGGIAYKKWTLAQSEIATVKINSRTEYFVEPKNETSTLALKIGAQY